MRTLHSLWVGEENVRVALQYAQFARDRTNVDDSHFNPATAAAGSWAGCRGQS